LRDCQGYANTNEKLSRHVEWKGPIWDSRKWDYYQGADLFCLPTFSENFGLTILEACQVGTPVLTTRHAPWGFLENWQAAFLVEPEIKSIRQGLAAFLKSEPWTTIDRENLAGRIHGQFNWENIGHQYAQLYRRLA
jgi:glycosyltransferase involved in cell wall biosynthesis